jgi:hypothetical protein
MENVYGLLIRPKFFCERAALPVGIDADTHALEAKNIVDQGHSEDYLNSECGASPREFFRQPRTFDHERTVEQPLSGMS